MNAVLSVRGISKTIGGKTLVEGISFEIGKGEIFGLLGPNGAGKTTTIRMLVGLIEPTSGSIAVCGHDVRKARREAMRGVGAIVENPELYGYLSGEENLRQFARLSRLEGADERIREVARLVGLEERLQEKVKRYSLGMRQRLGLAQALLHRPSLLILDEPTNGLDPAGMREFRQLLRTLASEGTAILLSSHLLGEIEQVCDRVGVIQNGRWVLTSAVGELGDPSQGRRLLIHVDSAEKALACLDAEGIEVRARFVSPAVISLVPPAESMNPLLKTLLNGGITIHRLEEQNTSLEDKFLEITGGNQG
ncbi:ABC transporter ATP-binding protein [Paenibacillus aurantius]|uniref:ABC transporter ATP-binding protein n=1 Tax=Paenibacillus aurantius TaxID=2918900 RepID=A0AA96LBK3_9BACL|nr:ABC transporter ATP-binding protein [Paenibacillus aurantius]WNQ10129.1 ABC transporter ATP-binding protein [Paenibacillus aurantius]